MNNNKLLRDFLRFVSLNVLGMIGLSGYILADTFFIAQGLGAHGLAALNLSISIYSIIHATGLMIGIGGATKFTILRTQRKERQANEVFTHSLIVGISIGSILALVGALFSDQLSYLLGADGNTFAMTNVYLKTILIFAPWFIMNNIFLAFVRNDGNPNLSMVAMLLGSICNVILDYFFIFPLNMGMFGAALATSIAPLISLAVLSWHTRGNYNFHLRKSKWQQNYVKDIGALGISAFITELSSGIALIVFNLVILRIAGNIGVAAYGIVANLALVAIAIFTGIAQGMQPLASSIHGQGNQLELQRILRYAMVTAVTAASAIYAVTSVFSNELVAVFNSENDLQLAQFAAQGLCIYFTGFLFAGPNIILAAFYGATEKAKHSLVVSTIRGGVAIVPLVLILARLGGMVGIWISFPAAEAITMSVGVALLYRQRRLIGEQEFSRV